MKSPKQRRRSFLLPHTPPNGTRWSSLTETTRFCVYPCASAGGDVTQYALGSLVANQWCCVSQLVTHSSISGYIDYLLCCAERERVVVTDMDVVEIGLEFNSDITYLSRLPAVAEGFLIDQHR